MRKPYQRWTMALACATIVGVTANQASSSIKLGGVLKGGAIVVAIRTFGTEVDKTINTVLAQRGLSYEGATKVVPIVSVGRGVNIGAAQVQGAKSFVDDVRAVGQVETRLGDFDGRLLIPTNTSTPGKDFRRIEGVGVSAVIDFRI
jgi:hypothetical protein